MYIYIYIHMCVCVCVCMYVCMYVYIYMYMYIYYHHHRVCVSIHPHAYQVSCKHAACLRNHLYMSEKFKTQKCGPLFDDWKKCFDAEVKKALANSASSSSSLSSS